MQPSLSTIPLLLVVALGCAAPERRAGGSAMPAPAAAPTPAPAPRAREPVPSAAPNAVSGAPNAGTLTPCGELGCLRFDSDLAAFRHVLAQRPRVLAIGEAHAQKGSESVASATRRFGTRLLPELAGTAKHLVIELWVASGDCGAVEKRVQKQQAPVTENQAAPNQSEFVLLGRRARELGIEPHALTPSCDEYREIAGAGPADIGRMLELMANATERELSRLLISTAELAPPPLIAAYGGALHNDVQPRPGREAWSFGPAIRKAVGGAYVELDLIVPEFVKDTDAWRALPWYDAYMHTHHGTDTLLFAPAPNAFVLVFAKSKP